MSNAARKRQLLALARSGGSAAVKAQGPTLWPSSVAINGNAYVLRGEPRPNAFDPSRIVGHYHYADRCIALTLEDAQRGSRSANGFS